MAQINGPGRHVYPPFETRLLRVEDIEELYGTWLIRKSKATHPGLAELLGLYASGKWGVTHSSFSRVLDNHSVTGHISAHLISNENAAALMRSKQDDKFFDLAHIRPLTDLELIENNQSLTLDLNGGSTLLVTNLYWRRSWEDDEFPELIVRFFDAAIDRMVRWFEGNTIKQVIFRCEPQFFHRIVPLLSTADDYCGQRMTLPSGTHLFRIRGPWTPAGVGNLWGSRLLDTYFEPVGTIGRRRRLKGRILYEFDFDIKKAVETCIPTWSYNSDQQMPCPSANHWRKMVAQDLYINKETKRRYPTMLEIRQRIATDPRLVALY